jgi:hypothetical protein
MGRQLLYLQGHSLKTRRPEHFHRCALCGGDATKWYLDDLSSWPFGVQVTDSRPARETSEIFTKESTTALPQGKGKFHIALRCSDASHACSVNLPREERKSRILLSHEPPARRCARLGPGGI